MRLWSINPKLLDKIGLVALWREALLAQKVLLGQTKGYKFHPQLVRFQACVDPVLAIGCYLGEVATEAERRGYRFDSTKIVKRGNCPSVPVHQGQMEYEWKHLLAKLQVRSPAVYETHHGISMPSAHPMFHIVPGGIETWERV
ncbi:MAG TPA: pyrimidine dimer DNA glycosylase/endonuclease V [Noviherbaspirillum sp.]|nr:pyrimidine dimer DNA glycosylase/endonuclease V [Noviherbaspirillum sp.]